MKLSKLILFIFLSLPVLTKADETAIVFDSANSAYSEGRYQQAIKMYEQILLEGKTSAALYFNLGNAYFKSNNIGLAILNYERAKMLDPDDEDILENLKLANQKTEDKIEAAPELFLSQWEGNIVDLLNEKEWSIFLIICIIVSLLCFSIYIFSSGKGMKQFGFFGGLVIILLGIFSFFMAKSKYNSTVNSASGIIVQGSVTVTGSPSEKGTKLFILHEGTKVRITEKNEDWTEIRIANGNVGWVRSTVIAEI
jgi:tetratricopeptide (TPR) repeat protein